MDFWEVLGIEPTDNEDEIKAAYRSRLTGVNPEDDPEGFMELREAYQQALCAANEKEDEEENTETHPLILVMEEIYDDYERRIDAGEWEKLFNTDYFVSLDTADDAKSCLFSFLARKNFLPHEVFKLIKETFDIAENRHELSEIYSDRLIDFIISNGTYMDVINYHLFTNVGDDVDRYISIYYSLDSAIGRRDTDEQERLINELSKMESKHPVLDMAVLYHELQMIDKTVNTKEERLEKYGDTLRKMQKKALSASEKYPDDLYTLLAAFDFSENLEDFDTSYKYLEKALEIYPDACCVRNRLGDYYYHTGEYEKSRDIFLRVLDDMPTDDWAHGGLIRADDALKEEILAKLSENPDDCDLKMDLAWCYYRNNLPEEAIKVLESFTPPEEKKGKYYGLLGRNYLYAGKPEKALKYFLIWKEEMEKLPEKRENKKWKYGYMTVESTCFFIAECYYRMKNYAEAEKYLEKALSQPNALINNAKETKCALLYDMGEYEQCIAHCMELSKIEDNYSAYFYMGKSFYEMEEYNEAIRALDKARSIYPYSAEIYYLILEMLYRMDDSEGMEYFLSKFDELGGESDRVELQRAKLYADKEDYAAANELLLKLLEKREEEEGEIPEEEDCLSDICYHLAANLEAVRKYREAADYSLKAAESSNNTGEKGYYICNAAGLLHIFGDFEESIRLYDSIISDEDYARFRKRAYVGKAAALGCMKHFEEAAEVFEACEAEYGIADYYSIDHAELYVRMNRFDEAVSFMEECIKKLEGNSFKQSFLGNLCCFYGDEGRLEEAYATFKRAVENDPDDYHIYRSMGMVYKEHGMYGEAEELLLKAIEMDTDCNAYTAGLYLTAIGQTDDITKPEYERYIELAKRQVENADDQYTYIRRAEVYLALGDCETALSAIEKALSEPRSRYEVISESPQAYYIKGLICEEMGDMVKAAESYARAVEVFGHNGVYEEMLRRVTEERK